MKREKIFVSLLAFALVIAEMESFSLVFIGYHEVDSAFNALKISYDTRGLIDMWKNGVDIGLNGVAHDYLFWYRKGLYNILLGSFMSVVVGIGIGLSLGRLSK